MSESTLALVSPTLKNAGFLHAFSLRAADDPALVLSTFLGVNREALYQVNQVHGGRVVHALGNRDEIRQEEADALVAAAPFAVGVRVADCVPVLVGDRASGTVAAIHAGWRGIVKGIIPAALREMPVGAKVAAIGPCIGACCFEVSTEVAKEIAEGSGAPDAVVRTPHMHAEKAYVDLRRAVRAQLRNAGLADADVDDVPGCTRCDSARFFSYRRDGANAGRQLGVIVARGANIIRTGA